MEKSVTVYYIYGFIIVGLITALILIILWREGKI